MQVDGQRGQQVVVSDEALKLGKLTNLRRQRSDLVPVQADVSEVHVEHVHCQELHAS